MKNQTRAEILANLSKHGIDLQAGESIASYVQRKQNEALLIPSTINRTPAVMDRESIIAKATAIDIARGQANERAAGKAAEANEKYADNPIADLLAGGLLESGVVHLTKKQRQHLTQVAEKRAEEIEVQRQEDERVRSMMESPGYATAIQTAEKWVTLAPDEFREEAQQNLANLKASVSVPDFYTAATSLSARIRAVVDNQFTSAAAAATAKAAEAQSLADKLTSIQETKTNE